MSHKRDNAIKIALERVISTFEKRPAAAQTRRKSSLRLEDGRGCECRQGEQTLLLDQPAPMGGDGKGPTPGFFGRAAIAGCLAQGIKMTAARREVPIAAITIDLEQDVDGRGALAMDGIYGGALDLRIVIGIESEAPRDVIQSVIDDTIEADTWLLNYRDAQKLSTSVVVSAPKAKDAAE